MRGQSGQRRLTRRGFWVRIRVMPIYEYQCRACSGEVEALQKLSDAPLRECPHCGADGLRKKISAVAFRLKGGGWYETDFKTEGKKNIAGEEKPPGKESGKEGGKDGAGESGKGGEGGGSGDGGGKSKADSAGKSDAAQSANAAKPSKSDAAAKTGKSPQSNTGGKSAAG